MAALSDKPKISKALVAAGFVLLIVALMWLVWGIGRFAWIAGLFVALRASYRYGALVVLLLLAVYLAWAWAHGRFAGFAQRDRTAALTCNLDDRRVAGLCSGIAQRLNIDTASVRVIALALLVLMPPFALVVYLVAALSCFPR